MCLSLGHRAPVECWSSEACEKHYKWLLNDWQWNGGRAAVASWSSAPRETVTESNKFGSAAPLGSTIRGSDLVVEGTAESNNGMRIRRQPTDQPAFAWISRWQKPVCPPGLNLERSWGGLLWAPFIIHQLKRTQFSFSLQQRAAALCLCFCSHETQEAAAGGNRKKPKRWVWLFISCLWVNRDDKCSSSSCLVTNDVFFFLFIIPYKVVKVVVSYSLLTIVSPHPQRWFVINHLETEIMSGRKINK